MFGRSKGPQTEEERYAAAVERRRGSKAFSRAELAEARAARAGVRAEGATPRRAEQARASQERHQTRAERWRAKAEEQGKTKRSRKG